MTDMIIATVEVSGTTVKTNSLQRIPRGIVGAKVNITYLDEFWKTLNVTAVFKSSATKDVTNISDTVTIPPEIVAKAGDDLHMGLYGITEDGTVALPTFWMKLGTIADAADPCGDESTKDSLPVWAQMEHRLDFLLTGELERLVSEKKQEVLAEILKIYPSAEEAVF